jgi:rhodanese-related sulfurtransferase
MTHSIDSKKLNRRLSIGEPVTLLDVRRKADYEADPKRIPNSFWRDPEKIDKWFRQLPSDTFTVVYCVKGGSVSQAVTDRLRREGLETVFLQGGFKNWIADGQPVEPIHDSPKHYTLRDADIELLRNAGVSEADIAHSIKVAEKALEIPSRIPKDLDMELVGRGAVFHD